MKIIAKIVNFLLKGTQIMATMQDMTQVLQDLQAAVNANNANWDSANLKLDEVLTYIQNLQVGAPLTQADFDALVASLTSIKDIAVVGIQKGQDVLAEADTLDGTP